MYIGEFSASGMPLLHEGRGKEIQFQRILFFLNTNLIHTKCTCIISYFYMWYLTSVSITKFHMEYYMRCNIFVKMLCLNKKLSHLNFKMLCVDNTGFHRLSHIQLLSPCMCCMINTNVVCMEIVHSLMLLLWSPMLLLWLLMLLL